VSAPRTYLEDGSWSSESSSLVDPVGQVIYYEGRVLRGIRKPFDAQLPRLLELAEHHRWFDHGLVPTWRTSLVTDEFPLILEHQRIPFVTVRGEWPAEGLRRAALCCLDFSVVLARSGHCLKDAHTWNMLFDGTSPRITDFGSIRPIEELHWPAWLAEFHKYFLAPLLLFARGETGLARALLGEHLGGVGMWMLDHAPDRLLPADRDVLPKEPYRVPETFQELHDLVSGLTFPHARSEWTAYAQPGSAVNPAELREKDRIVQMLLGRLHFTTAIDLGANRGLHASMCAAAGATVLACDIDESCLDEMFLRYGRSTEDVLPLYLNVVLPASATGAFQTTASAPERLKCDLVLALALVHHVCLRWQFSPVSFARGVAAFTRNAAIVEFVPPEDWHVAQWGAPIPPGYSLDGMHEALARLFERVERIPSEPAPRHIFRCEGKR
jgi:hypothetical protein